MNAFTLVLALSKQSLLEISFKKPRVNLVGHSVLMNIAAVSDFQLAAYVYSIPEYKAAFPTFVLPAPTLTYNLSRKCFQLLSVSYDASCGFIMHRAYCFEVMPSILHLFSILIMREC